MDLPYNPQVVKQFLPLFELNEAYTFIRYVKNWVFIVQQDKNPRILRITPHWRRTQQEITRELDFILHLAQGGMNVAPPLVSKEGNYIETIEFEGMTYHGVLFEHATGHRVQLETDWGPTLYTAWAQQIALMHKLSKEYLEMNPKIVRYAFNEEEHFKRARELIPATYIQFWNEYTELFEWLTKLPKTPDSYGLIHNDLIHSNLFFNGVVRMDSRDLTTNDVSINKEKSFVLSAVEGYERHQINGNQLTIIDFDDYCFGWFAYDIGISLFHIQVGCTRKGLPLNFTEFKEFFLKTYQETFLIDPACIESINKFIQLRKVSTYLWCSMNAPKTDFEPVRRFCDWIIGNF